MAEEEIVQARASVTGPDKTSGRLLVRITQQGDRETAHFWLRNAIEFSHRLDCLQRDRMEQVKAGLNDLAAADNAPQMASYDEIERTLVCWESGIEKRIHVPFDSAGVILSPSFIIAFNNVWKLVCEE